MNTLFERSAQAIFLWLSRVDTSKIKQEVRELKLTHPEATAEDLIQILIQRKAVHTAQVGAITSAASAVPVIGTALTLTAGMAFDLGKTITTQAELVLGVAEILDVKLNRTEQRKAVFVIMGLGAGIHHIGTRVSKAVLGRVGQRILRKAASKILPVAGIALAAGLNYVSTYLIGQRAKTYFIQGETALSSWEDSIQQWKEINLDKLPQAFEEAKAQFNLKFLDSHKS